MASVLDYGSLFDDALVAVDELLVLLLLDLELQEALFEDSLKLADDVFVLALHGHDFEVSFAIDLREDFLADVRTSVLTPGVENGARNAVPGKEVF